MPSFDIRRGDNNEKKKKLIQPAGCRTMHRKKYTGRRPHRKNCCCWRWPFRINSAFIPHYLIENGTRAVTTAAAGSSVTSTGHSTRRPPVLRSLPPAVFIFPSSFHVSIRPDDMRLSRPCFFLFFIFYYYFFFVLILIRNPICTRFDCSPVPIFSPIGIYFRI